MARVMNLTAFQKHEAAEQGDPGTAVDYRGGLAWGSVATGVAAVSRCATSAPSRVRGVAGCLRWSQPGRRLMRTRGLGHRVVGGGYGRGMTLIAPADWPSLPDGVLDAARRTALDALAAVPFEAYYDVAGGYAGATFAGASGNLPGDVTAGDLFAVTLLSVDVTPPAARRMLDEGKHRDRVLTALRAVPNDVPLAQAGAQDLEVAWALYVAVKDALANPRAKRSDPWVTAAKVAARKRPRLLPVRDNEVRRVLRLESYRDGRLEILTIRALVADPVVASAIDTALARARVAAQARDLVCVFDDEPLRLLDVALWWYAVRFNRPPVDVRRPSPDTLEA